MKLFAFTTVERGLVAGTSANKPYVLSLKPFPTSEVVMLLILHKNEVSLQGG